MNETSEVKAIKVFVIGSTAFKSAQPGPIPGPGMPPQGSKAQFERVADKLRNVGLTPVLPTDLTTGTGSPEEQLRTDVLALTGCDMVYLLESWPSSDPSLMLKKLAEGLRLPVIIGI